MPWEDLLLREDQSSGIETEMTAQRWVNTARVATTFWKDQTGLILPYVTIMLVVIIGISVLALDGARYMSLQSQLQAGVDALALAGAAETRPVARF